MTDVYVVLRRCVAVTGLTVSVFAGAAWAQTVPPATSAPAQAAARQRGTVKAISASTLTLTTDDGHEIAVTVTVGDRILVVGAAGADATTFQAGRVILMKSTDIAAQHAREEADWQRRGSGGIVTAVDAGTGTISMSVRGRAVAVKTTSTTIFRRYAGDSVKFEDAKRGTLDQIQSGDQMRVRGTRSADGSTLDADEVVSGRFENLSGTLTAVDVSAGTITLNDLATKKPVTVTLTQNSAIHRLPPGAATGFAGGTRPASSGSGQTGTPAASPQPPEGTATPGHQGARRAGGGDFSQMVARLPQMSVSDLQVGDAVLLVATPASPGSPTVTGITLVSGVQSLLSATQGSAPAVTLSPWSLGQTGIEGSGAQ